jgi:MoxR-like ATPase
LRGFELSQQEIINLREAVSAKIVGQQGLIERLLIAILADGHLLVEGAPGLAKTRAIKVLGEGIEGDFHRVQFTPDLLPADLTGTEIYRPQDGTFMFQRGPLFHNLILADEINRAPAKVQSALLEAMAERQITVGTETYALPRIFLVMATQNPLEQEGTYPLPEAQLDRFLMHVRVGYPSGEDELDSSLEDYIIEIVLATRSAERYGDELASWIQHGASPRATMALDRCARAYAWLNNRDYVVPEDIQLIAPDVLRHRIILSFEAEAEGKTADSCIDAVLAQVAVP